MGQALVDKAGMTLYFADEEADGSIKCIDDCLGFWFPAAPDTSTTDSGTPGSVPGLAVVRRPDTGKDQFTYQGKPLYTFKLDKAPGQHTGHNLTDELAGTTFTWRAATTTATTEAPPASDPGNYDY